ncbi:MAG: C10 family peptidase, partial [Kiritimatiellae bacterium]|nr:C10 family peptidase [Kiritimatiellia bacterium]
MNNNTIIRFATIAAAVVATSATLPLCAAEVAADEAREAAQGWAALQEALTGKERFAGAEIADVKSYEGKDGRGKFYVVSFEGGGFAVTSGDTEIAPILAYSEDGEFVASDESPLWVMLTTDVAGRTKRLENLAQSRRGAEDDEDDLEYGAGEDAEDSSSNLQPSTFQLFNRSTSVNASAWARLREAAKAPEPTGRPLLKAALPKVDSIPYPIYGPLCETKWNQYDANGGRCYNYYTPSNYLCGCVATAMAQVMKAFEWPTEKVSLGSNAHSGAFVWVDGATSVTNTMTWHAGGTQGEVWEFGGPAFGGPYDWENMVAVPNAGTLEEEQRQAIGLLCRDCGISVDMNYRLGGSGSSTARIGPQLVKQFGYRNAAVRSNGNAVSLSEQLDAYLPSFEMGSPCAVGIPGHAIVCDGYGYNSEGRQYVHYNYGWSASYWYTPPDEEESDTEYPIVKTIVYNIWTPGVDIAPDSSIVEGYVAEEVEYYGLCGVPGVTVTARDGLTGAEVSTDTDEYGNFTIYLPPGYDYVLTASTNGVEAARKKLGTVKCTSEAVGNKTGVRLLLGSIAEDTPVELLHRWSFEGETDAERLADTGSLASSETSATVCGTEAETAVTFADGVVSLSGDGNSKGYLTLGTNTIPDTATLEFWAREDGVKNWSRVFDYGIDTANYTMLAWTGGTSQRNDRFSVISPNASGNIDDMMAPYTPGTMYHISLTYERDATDGSTMVRVMRRDVKTGELQRMGSRTVANFTMSSLANAVLYLGHSLWEADHDANATYDEVRVWSGVLSDAQLKANAVAGPDVADLAEAQQIAAEADATSASLPVGGHTATRRGRITYSQRDGMATTNIEWPKIPPSSYSDDGEHEVAELNRAVGAGNAPDFLQHSQLRYDGWVEVTEDQTGWWTISQKFDDYFLFAIDGDFAIFNHTYNTLATSRVRVTEGWHRFTVICGDTYGSWGAEYVFGDMKVPFTVSVNGGDEMAFTPDNFTFGSDSGVVTLTENADWTAGGSQSSATVLSPGTVIDLNGHTLTVAGLAVDGIGGAVVTNSSARPGVLSIPGSATMDGVVVAEEVKIWRGGNLKWIHETAVTAGYTGEWDAPIAYDATTLKAELGGMRTFTPYEASVGTPVTIDVTASFDAVPDEEATPTEGTQGAIWLGTNGCFQVWTSGGWVDVEADGITPTTGVDYTFRFVFDYAAQTYSVAVQCGAEWKPLVGRVIPNAPSFPLATSASAVSGVRFTGDGVFTSLLGEYENAT